MPGVPHVLFVCVHNAGRSQMAAALLNQAAAGRVQVSSAGSQPASEISPAVIQAMAEVGLDLSRAFPKPLTGDQVQAADIVVTWDAATPAPSIRASGIWTGNCPTPPDLTLPQSAPSATPSASTYAICSTSWLAREGGTSQLGPQSA
jgi:arsenate reductase